MPIPSPHKGESKKDFIESCMSDEVMNKEFPDQKQRYAVCMSRFSDKKAKASLIIKTPIDEFIYLNEKKTDK